MELSYLFAYWYNTIYLRQNQSIQNAFPIFLNSFVIFLYRKRCVLNCMQHTPIPRVALHLGRGVRFLAQRTSIPRFALLCLQKQRLSARSGVRTLDTLIKRHFIHYASPCSSSHTIQVFFPSCIFRARTVNSRIVSPVNTRNRSSRKMRQPRILSPPLMVLRNAFTV